MQDERNRRNKLSCSWLLRYSDDMLIICIVKAGLRLCFLPVVTANLIDHALLSPRGIWHSHTPQNSAIFGNSPNRAFFTLLRQPEETTFAAGFSASLSNPFCVQENGNRRQCGRGLRVGLDPVVSPFCLPSASVLPPFCLASELRQIAENLQGWHW